MIPIKANIKNSFNQWFSFADGLLEKLSIHDVIETASGKKCLHIINRYTRFSKEKSPYKNNWSGGFSRATKERRGGYYFHIEPGNTFVAGGFFGPNTEDLKRVRDEISRDSSELRVILKSKEFKTTFGSLQGEQLKTTPKGLMPMTKRLICFDSSNLYWLKNLRIKKF